METISLRRVVPGNFTRRRHWAVDRGKNFGYALRQHDYIYARAVNNEEEIESLCEIGSDIGRSTAWFCEIAQTIDVYEQGAFWIDICKTQCYNQQKAYGRIRNVNWHDTGSISITEVLKTLPKQYHAIKLATTDVIDYVPLLMDKLLPKGRLFIHEEGTQDSKDRLVKMLRDEYNMSIKRADIDLFVAKHK